MTGSTSQPPPKQVDIQDKGAVQALVDGLYFLWATVNPSHEYTVATVPAAADWGPSNKLIYVSDEVGGSVPAFSDGTDWRRVTDRAVIST